MILYKEETHMKITSPNWDERNGVCIKHWLPQVPCPACMASGGDEDVEFILDETDRDLDLTTIRNLVPVNFTNPQFR